MDVEPIVGKSLIYLVLFYFYYHFYHVYVVYKLSGSFYMRPAPVSTCITLALSEYLREIASILWQTELKTKTELKNYIWTKTVLVGTVYSISLFIGARTSNLTYCPDSYAARG